MFYLRTLGTREPLAVVSPADIEFLRGQLESVADGAPSFYIDVPTVELLHAFGASAELLAALTDAVRDRGDAELEIVEGRAGGALSPVHLKPTNADDSGVVQPIVDVDPITLSQQATMDDEANLEVAASETDAAVERAFGESIAPNGPTRLIHGIPLNCVVCGGTEFKQRTAQLHSAAATFFGFEWTGPSAECYICQSCGYLHWFMN